MEENKQKKPRSLAFTDAYIEKLVDEKTAEHPGISLTNAIRAVFNDMKDKAERLETELASHKEMQEANKVEFEKLRQELQEKISECNALGIELDTLKQNEPTPQFIDLSVIHPEAANYLKKWFVDFRVSLANKEGFGALETNADVLLEAIAFLQRNGMFIPKSNEIIEQTWLTRK